MEQLLARHFAGEPAAPAYIEVQLIDNELRCTDVTLHWLIRGREPELLLIREVAQRWWLGWAEDLAARIR